MLYRDDDRNVHDAFEGRQVLVAGGAGFIGSHLVEALLEARAVVTVIDCLRSGSKVALAGLDGQLQVTYSSVEDVCSLTEPPWSKLDFIFHLANEAYVPPSLDDPLNDLYNNVRPTLTILEMARRWYPDSVVVYTSSAAVYGEPATLPITEQHALTPVSPYGVSKLAAEQYVSLYARIYGLQATVLRLFSVFGPRQQKQVVYDLFRKLALDPEKLEIIGDGTQTRDLVFVKDVVNALLIVACRGSRTGEPYNVATGRMITIRELALKIANLMDASPRFEFTHKTRAGDPDRWLADISKVALLGFQPSYSLDSGLLAVKEWLVSAPSG